MQQAPSLNERPAVREPGREWITSASDFGQHETRLGPPVASNHQHDGDLRSRATERPQTNATSLHNSSTAAERTYSSLPPDSRVDNHGSRPVGFAMPSNDAESMCDPPTAGSALSYHTSNQSHGGGEGIVSHGTLMLAGTGQSRYLGPTAGSEWLKDVCEPLTQFQNRPG